MPMEKCSSSATTTTTTTTAAEADDSPTQALSAGVGGGGGGEEERSRPSSTDEVTGRDRCSHGGISKDVDIFLAVLDRCAAAQVPNPPEIPEAVSKFVSEVEDQIATSSSSSLLDAVDRLAKLTASLTAFSSRITYSHAVTRATSVLQRAISLLDDDLLSFLEASPDPPYPPDAVENLRRIAAAMISAGYETECCQTFSIARRNASDASLASLGFKKPNTDDDIQKLPWETLKSDITTWIKAFRQSITSSFSDERALCDSVFSGHPRMARGLFSNLARGTVIQLLNFAEAVAATKPSDEKLFKVLDMYETLRDMEPEMDRLFGATDSAGADLRSEISSVKRRLGEAAIAIFCELETSIKADVARSAVPGGAIHPLTRYVMNYLKYACEYKSTLEHVFEGGGTCTLVDKLTEAMDLLQENLETKSKLYKDSSLSNIFLMNNGRYILQKVKGSSEAYELLGAAWCRRRSSELRQYHKNYQRETWSKVLACLKEEGMMSQGAKGAVRAAVKERLKSFNGMMEEIHKTQSLWVVSDEQLQSELRVSVAAVVVPAYRSFLGRYGGCLKQGRQTEKYLKFGPDDLENYIDELFAGNPSSPAKRKG